MAGKVLLVNQNSALLTDALVSGLKAMDITAVPVEPDIECIRAEQDGADVIVIFAGDFMYESPEVLVYIKDICFGETKVVCAVGYAKELTEIEETIPKSMIEKEFMRPIDVKSITRDVHNIMSKGAERNKGKHILLVDDDVTFLKMMQSWLCARYRITVVRSGMQAITYIAAHVPDLILLDYDMPITPGPQVLEMIRSEPTSAKIPVIFLTGKADRDSVLSVMRLKPEGYLLKTMKKDEIINSIDRFFESKKWENVYG
ncbi:MAG: response regulator [Ruminococcaceae bacterium]|jgi:CheY-like chemotaxis protein|nr:response regulator [Oscillospiraceae bacterium]